MKKKKLEKTNWNGVWRSEHFNGFCSALIDADEFKKLNGKVRLYLVKKPCKGDGMNHPDFIFSIAESRERVYEPAAIDEREYGAQPQYAALNEDTGCWHTYYGERLYTYDEARELLLGGQERKRSQADKRELDRWLNW